MVFAGSGATTIFSVVQGCVKAISNAECPCFQGASDTPFWQQVKEQLLLFATTAQDGSTGRTLVGGQVLMHQFRELSDQVSAPSVHQLTNLVVFGWIVVSAQTAGINAWREAASADAAKSPGIVAGKSSSSSSTAGPATIKAGTSKAKTDKAKALDDMTKLLFTR